jgi:uncharacterized protein (TIGR02246 family)
VDDIEAIRQLKARYFRTIDTKDWAGLRDVFTDDVVVDSVESGGEEFLAFLPQALDGVVSVHHGHMPEIEVTSATTATGIWAMEDMLRWPNGMELHGYGHYHETYRKTDAGWRIATTKLTRLRQDMTPPSEEGS